MSERRTWSAWLANFRSGPDRGVALARDPRRAQRYEAATAGIRDVRGRAIDLLALLPGETVFAVACDAGAVLRELSWRVGLHGRVVGVEQNPEMAARAIESSGGCDNVCVICEPAETVRAAVLANAVIFCYTHDVLQTPQALANVFAQARPGARVSVAGPCLLPAWGAPVSVWMRWRARHSLTTWSGLRTPWVPLLDWCLDLLLVERYHCGTGYLAAGAVRLH